MYIQWFNEERGFGGRIVFDTSDEEIVETTCQVTEHPIETGSTVNDHVIRNMTRLNIQATVSNTPIRQPETQMRDVRGEVRGVDLGGSTRRAFRRGAQGQNAAQYEEVRQALSANVLQFDGDFDRVVDVYLTLLGLQEDRQLFTVVTSLNVWENCILESLTAPRDSKSGGSVVFSLGIVQLTFADSQTVAAPEPSQPRGRRQRSRGSQNAQEAGDNDNRSALARFVDFVSGD